MRKIRKIHIKYPQLEQIIIFLLGNYVGISGSLFVSVIVELKSWLVLKTFSPYNLLFSILVSIIYYLFFSKEAIMKKIQNNNNKKIIEANYKALSKKYQDEISSYSIEEAIQYYKDIKESNLDNI